MKISLTGRLAGLLLTTGLATSATVALAPAVSAAPSPAAAVTTLSFTPATGSDVTPMYLITPKPCPTPATNVLVMAVGHGFPAGGQVVVSNSTSGVSHDAPFILPLQDTFEGFASINGTTLQGSYVLTMRCSNRLGSKTYATWTGTVSFSDATHYTAPAPAKSVVEAIAASQNPAASETGQPTPGATASSPAQQQGSVAGQSAQPGAQQPDASKSSDEVTSANTSAKVEKSTKSNDVWQPILVATALLLIAFAIVMRVREVRRDRRRAVANAVLKAASENAPKTTSSTGSPA
jgi:hypothetical protein